MSQDTTSTAWLVDHPRLLGALCTLVLLWVEVGGAIATGSSTAGP